MHRVSFRATINNQKKLPQNYDILSHIIRIFIIHNVLEKWYFSCFHRRRRQTSCIFIETGAIITKIEIIFRIFFVFFILNFFSFFFIKQTISIQNNTYGLRDKIPVPHTRSDDRDDSPKGNVYYHHKIVYSPRDRLKINFMFSDWCDSFYFATHDYTKKSFCIWTQNRDSRNTSHTAK